MAKKIFFPAALGLLLAAAAIQPVLAGKLELVSCVDLADKTVVTIQLDMAARYEISSFDKKIVVDLDETVMEPPHQMFSSTSSLVWQVRSSQFTARPPVVRVVLDLNQEAAALNYRDVTSAGDNKIQLEITRPASADQTAQKAVKAEDAAGKPPAPTKTEPSASSSAATAAKEKTTAAKKPEAAEILLNTGQSFTLDLPRAASNIAIGDPGVADFVIINPREILLNGKKEGTTSLTIWSGASRKDWRIIVSRQPSFYETKTFKLSNIRLETSNFANDVVTNKTDDAMVAELDKMLAAVLSKDKYSINTRMGSVTVQGTDSDLEAVTKLLARVDKPRAQVMIETQVVEINRQAAQKIGLTWLGQTGKTVGGFSTSTTNPPKIYGKYPKTPGMNPDTGQTGVTIDPVTGLPETMPSPTVVGATIPKTYPPVVTPLPGIIDDSYQLNAATNLSDLITGGGIIYDSRSTAAAVLMAQLSALETDGRAKILANPRLVTLDGQTSTILVGQKVPIINRTSDAITVQYIDIGVKLAITPRVGSDGQILTWLRTETSSISSYIDTYPLISSREAEAEVRLKDGQTLVIGGLLQRNDSKSDTKVPLLGDLPLIGLLFRGKSDTLAETEILITITPRLLKE